MLPILRQHKCSEILSPFLFLQDAEITLICKALLIRLTSASLILNEGEINSLETMLRTDLDEPFSVHGLSFRTLFLIIQDILRISENIAILDAIDMPEIVGNISDRLYSDDQEIAYRIIETLLKGEVTGVEEKVNDLTLTLSTDHDMKSSPWISPSEGMEIVHNYHFVSLAFLYIELLLAIPSRLQN